MLQVHAGLSVTVWASRVLTSISGSYDQMRSLSRRRANTPPLRMSWLSATKCFWY